MRPSIEWSAGLTRTADPDSEQLAASVVVVADYRSEEGRTWKDERRCLTALATQQVDSAFEVIIVENEDFAAAFPPDLLSIVPRTRAVFSPSKTSYALKNAGARAAAAPVTVIIDADCQLQDHWLAILLETMRARPDVSVVSGRTSYESDALSARLLGLVTRSYLDPGHAGETGFIANNAAGFRSAVLREHPLPEDLGPFSARVQSESMLRAGHKLWFEPRLKVIHEFEGWPMEADIRRNIGYGTVAIRLAESGIPYAGLVRLGLPSVPAVVSGKLLNTWRDCLRCASAYGVRWFEVPLAIVAAVAVNLMEIPGMVAAFRKKPIERTAYR